MIGVERKRRLLCSLLPLLAGLAAATRAEPFTAPVTDASGTVTVMQAMLCRPAEQGLARLVVIAHGSPPRASDRPLMTLIPCDSEAVRWFTSRGYAVATVLRRGYGATGGEWAETYGLCSHPDFARAGLETARDLAAVVAAGTRLPGVRPDGVVVVGQSAGGWGADAYNSLPHPNVIAIVSMAGGRGGHADNQPNHNCAPDALAAAAGQYGATASTPMLWVYAANDSYFAPAIASALHASFTAAGGQADLHQEAAYGSDGHRLFLGPGGSAVWGPLMEAYLARMNAPPR